MGLLEALPAGRVEVAGGWVAVATGWRDHVRIDGIDRTDPAGQAEILAASFGAGGDVPPEVAASPAAALGAALSWHDGAMGSMPYGRPARGRKAPAPAGRGVLDWGADAAIIAADFLRFYRIDLLSGESDGIHWYRFCALLLALLRTTGSLVGQAAYARSPHQGARREERGRLERLAASWALPPTDAELRELARARFEG